MKKVSVEKKDASSPAATSNLKELSSAHANFEEEEEKNNNPLNSFDDQTSKISINIQKEREEIYPSKKEFDVFTKEDRNSNISKLFLTNPFSEEKKIEKSQETEKIIAKKMVFNIEKKKLDRPKAKKIEKNDISSLKRIFPTENEKQSQEEKKREVSAEKTKKTSEPLETMKTNVDSKKEKEPIKEKSNENSSENTLMKEMRIKKLEKAGEVNKELTQTNQEKTKNKHINFINEAKELKNIEKERINPPSENNLCYVKKKIKKLRDYDSNDNSSVEASDDDQQRKRLKKNGADLPINCLASTADKIKVIINNDDLLKDKEIKRKYKLEEEEKDKDKNKDKHREKDKEKEKIIEKHIKKKLHEPNSYNPIVEEKNLFDPKKREKSRSESTTSKEKTLTNENFYQPSINEGTNNKNPNKGSDLITFKENKTENRKEDVNESKANEKKDEKSVERSKIHNYNLEVKHDKKKNEAILEGDLMVKKMKIDQQKKKSGLTRLISGMEEVNTLVLKKFKLDWIHYVDKKYNEPDINKVFENLSIN